MIEELNGIRELSGHFDLAADRSGERGEPADIEPLSEHAFETLPRPATPILYILLFQVLNPRLVVPNRLNLHSKHDDGEDGEEERLKHQTNEQYYRPRSGRAGR